MSRLIHCERCDSYVAPDPQSQAEHSQMCSPGYDPYNSADRDPQPLQFNGRDDHRSNDFNLPMLLRKQAS